MTIRKSRTPAGLALSLFLAGASAGSLLTDAVFAPPAAAQDVDDGYFYSALAPDGEWFYQAEFGWVWHPTRVEAGWRPYTDGQWVWSDGEGWVWATDEPWGWATYHYGRWYFDPIYAWSWVPGRTWAPAWVSWRREAGYVGWAPLWPAYFDEHPDDRWDRWSHDGDWNRRHDGRDWDRWVFTRDRDFTSEHVDHYVIRDRGQRDHIFGASRDVTQWDGDHPERMGRGIDRRMIEKATGRPVRNVRLETADKPGQRRQAGADHLDVFRPRIQENRDKTPDRLGFAKEPTKDRRGNDTIREEKKRLDAVPGRDKQREKNASDPAVREKNADRGGVPEPRGASGADSPKRGDRGGNPGSAPDNSMDAPRRGDRGGNSGNAPDNSVDAPRRGDRGGNPGSAPDNSMDAPRRGDRGGSPGSAQDKQNAQPRGNDSATQPRPNGERQGNPRTEQPMPRPDAAPSEFQQRTPHQDRQADRPQPERVQPPQERPVPRPQPERVQPERRQDQRMAPDSRPDAPANGRQNPPMNQPRGETSRPPSAQPQRHDAPAGAAPGDARQPPADKRGNDKKRGSPPDPADAQPGH